MARFFDGRIDSLHLAAICNDEEAVLFHLQYCDVDAVDTFGRTALHCACDEGRLNTAKLLLDKGSSIHSAVTHFRDTALHIAARHGYAVLVGLLLTYGADVHAVNHRGYTALHCAAQTSSENTIQQLLSNGADISAVSHDGRNALAISCQVGDSSTDKVATLLIRSGADVRWVDTQATTRGLTLVHYAAVSGLIETMQLLLDMQVDVDAANVNGRTALHMACKRRVLNAVECLLQNGARVGYQCRNGFTVLHFVVSQDFPFDFSQYVQIVDLLFKYGADVNVENVQGYTPLDLALRESIVVFKVFVKQLMTMKDQGFIMSEHNLKAISENEEAKSLSESCEEEIERMRKSAIGDSSVKIYDIFTKGPNRLADFVSNEKVERVLHSDIYITEFPIYACEICSKFYQGKERRDLLRQSSDWLWEVICEFYDLPYVCVERINRYLTNADLALQISHEPSQPEEVSE